MKIHVAFLYKNPTMYQDMSPATMYVEFIFIIGPFVVVLKSYYI